MSTLLNTKEVNEVYPNLVFDNDLENFSTPEGIRCYTKTWKDDGTFIHVSTVLAEILDAINSQGEKYAIGLGQLTEEYIEEGVKDSTAPKWMRIGHSERTIVIPIRKL